MPYPFKTLEKKNAKLYLNLYGLTGCGKTYTSLLVGTEFASSNEKVLIIDTEKRSHYYANDFKGVMIFEAQDIKISELLAVIKQAKEECGTEVVIIDSLTPFWDSIVAHADTLTNKQHGANWKLGKNAINTMTLALRRCGLHMITTSLAKDELNSKMEPTGNIVPAMERRKFEPYLDLQGALEDNGKIAKIDKILHHDLKDIFQVGTQINKEWVSRVKKMVFRPL